MQVQLRPLQKQAFEDINNSDTDKLLVVASTGFGKTLVILLLALQEAKYSRVIISSYSKQHQAQLERDAKALGIKAVTLYGKANYICLEAVQKLLDANEISQAERTLLLHAKKKTMMKPQFLAEAKKYDVDGKAIWSKINAAQLPSIHHPDNCLQRYLEQSEDEQYLLGCFQEPYYKAKIRAMFANIVIANHSLARYLLKEDWYNYAVWFADEAHKLPDAWYGRGISHTIEDKTLLSIWQKHCHIMSG